MNLDMNLDTGIKFSVLLAPCFKNLSWINVLKASKVGPLFFLLLLCFGLVCFVWPCPWHVEVPGPGTNPCHSSDNTGSFTTRPPGKPLVILCFLFFLFFVFFFCFLGPYLQHMEVPSLGVLSWMALLKLMKVEVCAVENEVWITSEISLFHPLDRNHFSYLTFLHWTGNRRPGGMPVTLTTLTCVPIPKTELLVTKSFMHPNTPKGYMAGGWPMAGRWGFLTPGSWYEIKSELLGWPRRVYFLNVLQVSLLQHQGYEPLL